MSVFLVIYEFKIGGIIPAYHTEIVIGEMSLGWGEEGLEIHQRRNLDNVHGYRLVRSIQLGNSRRNPEQIGNIIQRMAIEWPAQDYSLFYRNCRHFSMAFINELDCDSTAEARRVLAGLIMFSERVGWLSSVLITALVQRISWNPIMMMSRPLEIINQGRILDMDHEFKVQLLQVLCMMNGFWILFHLVASLFENYEENNEEDELANQIENLGL